MLQFRVSEVDFDQHYFKVGGLQLHKISDRQSDTKVWNGNKAKDYCALMKDVSRKNTSLKDTWNHLAVLCAHSYFF